MKCDSWNCPICRWGECVGDRESAKDFGWCEKSDNWKPNEEQMEALKVCGECKRCIKKLYEQLKAL